MGIFQCYVILLVSSIILFICYFLKRKRRPRVLLNICASQNWTCGGETSDSCVYFKHWIRMFLWKSLGRRIDQLNWQIQEDNGPTVRSLCSFLLLCWKWCSMGNDTQILYLWLNKLDSRLAIFSLCCTILNHIYLHLV